MVCNPRNYWVFGLCSSSGILKNTTFWKLVRILSSGERVGGTYSVGSIRKRVLDVLADLHVLSTPEYEKVAFGMLCVCLCAPVAPERLDGFYSYSIFKSLLVISLYPVDMNILAPQIRVLNRPHPRTQNCNFVENGTYDFY
jgi:hypothetical protein